MLQSQSGYCMPFEERNNNVQLLLGYGKQKHPATGEEFFHHGVDFHAPHYLLSALATGQITGIGKDGIHGITLTMQFGNYEVLYGHLSSVYAQFGKYVKAGQTVAVSHDILHMEVRYNGQEIDPLEFVTMLYGNIKTQQFELSGGEEQFAVPDMEVHNDYESNEEEIEELMMRFFPMYMGDLIASRYMVPSQTELSLRNLFSLSAIKECFFETIPNMANPLGMGRKSIPLITKAQNLLIGDFLNYLALRQHVFLSTMSLNEKKKRSNMQ